MKKQVRQQMAIPIWLLVVYLVILVIVGHRSYASIDFWENVLVEAHGMFLDLLVLGVLLTWLNLKNQEKIKIETHLETIEDFRGWRSEEASFRIRGNVKRLQENKIYEVDLGRCYLKRADLKGFNLSKSLMWGVDLGEANLRGAELKNVKMKGGYLGDSVIRGVSFVGSYLKNCRFPRTSARGADFSECCLEGAEFWDSDLQAALFHDADLSNVKFGGANLTFAKLQNAKNLTEAQLSQAKCLHKASIEEGLRNQLKESNPELFKRCKK